MTDSSKVMAILSKERLKSFLKSNDHIMIILVVLLTIIFKFSLFFTIGNQPVWWDEGDYLSLAKFWSSHTPLSDGMSYLLGMRPFLLSLLMVFFFKSGLGESSIRFFLELVPSIASVVVIYLISRDLYGKWAGIASSLMLSSYWVWNFYSFRIMTDIPSTFLALLSIYFFLIIYRKKGIPRGLYLSVLFGVLAFFTRFPQALILLTIALYLLITKKLSLFKDKTIWKATGLLLVLLLPYFIYLASTGFAALRIYFGGGSTTNLNPIALSVITSVFSFAHWPLALLIIIGLLSLIPLIISCDIVFKQKDKSFNNDLLLLMLLVVQLFFYIFIIRSFEDRWLLMTSIILFIIAGKGFVYLESLIKPYIKGFAIIICFLLLMIGVYQNINHSKQIITARETSYAAVRDAGSWLADNSLVDESVISSSIVQNYYYSGRVTNNMMPDMGEFSKDCLDTSNNIISTPQCQKSWEESFNKKILKIKPSYFIISVYESSFTPGWAYDYPQRNNLTFIKAFFQPEDSNNPSLIIYKFPQDFFL